MNKKRLSHICALLLTLVVLVGLVSPATGSAATVEIKVLNPKAQLEPYANQPLADRSEIMQKVKNGETVDILILWYEKDLNCDIGFALGELLAEKWAKEYGTTVRLIPANGRSFSAGMMGSPIAPTAANYWKNNVAQYITYNYDEETDTGSWTTLADLPDVTPETNPRPPILGTPWGPKSGVAYGGGRQDGYNFGEVPFERYEAYAQYDAVIYGFAD